MTSNTLFEPLAPGFLDILAIGLQHIYHTVLGWFIFCRDYTGIVFIIGKGYQKLQVANQRCICGSPLEKRILVRGSIDRLIDAMHGIHMKC